MNTSDPDYDNWDFDYEIPYYVYGYYNGEESDMAKLPDNWGTDALPPLRQRKRSLSKYVKSPLDLTTHSSKRDEQEEMQKENENLKDDLEDSNKFFSRLRDRKLEKAGFPSCARCIGEVVLISVGDSERVYETLLVDVSQRGRSIRIAASERKNGATTISQKMEGWWLVDKLRFIDTIFIPAESMPEGELPRNIV